VPILERRRNEKTERIAPSKPLSGNGQLRPEPASAVAPHNDPAFSEHLTLLVVPGAPSGVRATRGLYPRPGPFTLRHTDIQCGQNLATIETTTINNFFLLATVVFASALLLIEYIQPSYHLSMENQHPEGTRFTRRTEKTMKQRKSKQSDKSHM